MAFLHTIITHKWAITKFLVILGIYSYVIFNLYFPHVVKSLRQEWHTLRYKPWAAPFASLLQSDKKGLGLFEEGLKAIMKMFWVYAKMFFKMLTKPFQYIIKLVHKIILWLKSIMDKIRQQLMVIRKLLLSIVQAVMERLQNLAASFINIFFRLRDMMRRSYASYKMIMYVLETVVLTLKSIMNGPIGTMAHLAVDLGYIFTFFLLGPLSFLMFPSLWHCLFCFHPDTKITLTGGTSSLLKHLTLGQSIAGGEDNQVLGLLVFRREPSQELYCIGKDRVTGTHPVQNNEGEWVWASTYSGAQKDSLDSEYAKTPFTVNLVTVNHRIQTPNAYYLDWEELDHPDEVRYQKGKILSRLNGWSFSYSQEHLYQEGFSPGILNHWLKCNYTEGDYQHLSPQDLINLLSQHDCNKIIGLGLWSVDNQTQWYRLVKSPSDGHYVTGSTLVYESDYELWIPVYASPSYEKVPNSCSTPRYIVHLVTDDAVINLQGQTYRDLLEIHSHSLHAMFSSRSLKHLNQEKYKSPSQAI